MTLLKIIFGALFLAYPVYAAVGLGLAVCVFIGIALLMAAVHDWFIQTRHNVVIVAYKLSKGFDNDKISRNISSLR